MAPRPYSERVAEPFDFKPLTEELPSQQGQAGHGETPSPRTPTTTGSLSPPIYPQAATTALVPILSEDGIPYDHTLPHYIRQVSGEPSLEEVQNITLRVLTETASLQQMTLYTPNLRELNLEGSALSSLRDIGSELRFLQVLRIGRCRLTRLDGTLGLTSLRELYAAGNFIVSAAPCAHLSRLRVLDLSRNQIQHMSSLSFLASCKHLQNVRMGGNPVASNPDLQNYLQSILPALNFFDDTAIVRSGRGDDGSSFSNPQHELESPLTFERQDSSSESNSSRVSSASSNSAFVSTSGDNEIESFSGPSCSNASVSKLTSGQILCGNIAAQRRKRPSTSQEEQDGGTEDALNASRKWRAAYYKFREINAANWDQENEQHSSETDARSESGDKNELSSTDDDDAEPT